ncbi:MAG: nucleotidyltransferase domain-containing protein [Candidatus Sericytochromatia bacterium]
MNWPSKTPPLQTALELIRQQHSGCLAAFWAGSLVRDGDNTLGTEATDTSDLDIVVVTEAEPAAAYRRSQVFRDWPVESFVHTPDSLLRFFDADCQRRRPALVQMCHEGLILWQENGHADRIKAEAQRRLLAGPPPLSEAERLQARYQLSDLREDLAGCRDHGERLLIAARIAEQGSHLALTGAGRWGGQGKWALRALRQAQPARAQALVTALEQVYQQDARALLNWLDTVLSELGGFLFDGYYLGAEP